MSISTEERRSKILALLNEHEKVTVAKLIELFKTSAVTVRKDLTRLEEQGWVHRVYGGAVLREKVAVEISFRQKIRKRLQEKEMIGKFASSLIEDGDTVIIGSGTTAIQLAKNIRRKQELTVITNGLDIVSELSSVKGVNIIVLGGNYRQGLFELVGPLTTQALSHLHVDKVFLGTDGLSVRDGLTTPDILAAETYRLMCKAGKEVIVIADYSKMGKVSLATIVPLTAVDKLITDEGIKEEDKRVLKKQGIEVIVV